ncbi:hypothetical protein GEV33_007852 [Tenebrio molitor]|uniref:Transposase n=1 Tax=Tenebrio molitor TaxID=7067 RepID=A0A8J6HHU5_TENMO|nr:hypothetical protein GEV33_007852 [Tenebrio molitor]
MESGSCEGVAIPSTSSVAVQNEVPLLSSGEEGDLEDEAVMLPKKKRSDNKVWIFVEKFESIKDAEEAIKTANTWSSLRKHEVEEAKVEGIKLPKMSQLRNYLYDQRRSKYGKPTISLGELEAWLSSHSTVPEDDDEVYVLSLQPDVLVCDAFKAIQNAFVEIFGAEVTVRMCWAHAKRKIQARVEQVTRKEVQKQLLDDVDSLQAATDPEIFSLAAKAFLLKWHSETDFIKYFEEQWLIQNRNWYLGVNLGSPATKNALESFNRVIKDEHTLRERFPISRFLVVATEMRQIAEILNVPKSSVNSIIQKYRQRGTVERQPGSGRHRISTIEEDEALVNTVRLNPFTTAVNAVAVTNFPGCVRTALERLTSDVYIRILEDVMIPSVTRIIPNNFIFQQENCSVHTARRVRAWIENHNINVLDWPSRSPDLNPIENMWGLLIQNLQQQRLVFRNREELLTAINNTWQALPQGYHRDLSLSMPKRKGHYIPNPNMTIYEMLVPFGGRCSFRMYIPSKPAKYGVKIQILADSQTHYMLNAEVYTVKALVRADKTTLSHPTQVVLRMVKPVENTNRNITGNNWYTSMELVDQLKKKA